MKPRGKSSLQKNQKKPRRRRIGTIGRSQGREGRAQTNLICAERSNLTTRIAERRFTRLTNAFSKVQNHECAIALHFFYYNFCRVHMSLNTTPAVSAGAWTVEDMVKLLEREESILRKVDLKRIS